MVDIDPVQNYRINFQMSDLTDDNLKFGYHVMQVQAI